MTAATEETASRRDFLSILAGARPDELEAAWNGLDPAPGFTRVRGPETGLVMLRGRVGGGGAPFNFGEASVARCVVRIDSGEVGFGHVLGRDTRQAELVACFDALLQNGRYREHVVRDLIAPVAARVAAEDGLTRRRTAATRVNFFTMVRGEDQ